MHPLCTIPDFRITILFTQAHGGAGLHDDLPLASFQAWARVLRIADGPDEVHLRAVARNEYKKASKL